LPFSVSTSASVPAERGATKRGVHLGNQLFEGVLLRAERAREIAIKPVRGAAGVPGMNGLEVLRRLRRWGIADPVIFLTMLSDDILRGGGAGGRRHRFHRKIAPPVDPGETTAPDRRGSAPGAGGGRLAGRRRITARRLELRFNTNLVRWAGTLIDLTVTGFKIIALLVLRIGEDVSYREIYDLVHGKNFAAGYGDEGYRANVRTFIKRIRKKLLDVDPEFKHIHNYPGFGYRYYGASH
jgi:two-component system, OmpR family, response regulator ChvI